LAAGVAHEINNPTGFVSSNLKTLSDYQHDMNQLITDYQKLKSALKALPENLLPAAVNEILSQVEATEQDVDIEYIQEDVDDLIGDCREGTERIKKIVDDLKHFAHPGEDKMKETDINAGIESTLNVVYNELKYKATIVKELGELPIIQAHPQQLNQVFMNILVNAAQAIEKTGEIKITTTTVDGKAEIRISDTGCGIAEENINKIFDPFFTTKDVGKGTGLGMNIAYNIISKHNGDIRVESTVGEGTTFIIQLPAGSAPDDDTALSAGKTIAE
jgi:signal transduction histidine kinase